MKDKHNARSMSRVDIVGTSHVSEESAKTVKNKIASGMFTIVCVELDKQRLYGLTHEEQTIKGIKSIKLVRHIGLTGFIFALIASYAQKKISKKVDLKAGSDMLTAVQEASKNNMRIALIDQDVNATLRKLSKEVKFKEKIVLVGDMLKSMFGMKSALTDMQDDFDLKKTPPDAIVEKILEKTKSRYRGLYKVLVHDRNKIMAERIYKILDDNPDENVLVVIGAGHKEGMIKILEKETGEKYDRDKHFKSPQKNEEVSKNKGMQVYSDRITQQEL